MVTINEQAATHDSKLVYVTEDKTVTRRPYVGPTTN